MIPAGDGTGCRSLQPSIQIVILCHWMLFEKEHRLITKNWKPELFSFLFQCSLSCLYILFIFSLRRNSLYLKVPLNEHKNQIPKVYFIYWKSSESFVIYPEFVCQLLCDGNMPRDVDIMDLLLFVMALGKVVELLWPNMSQSKAIYNACVTWTLCFSCSKHFTRSKLMHIPMHVSSLVETQSINHNAFHKMWLGMKLVMYHTTQQSK